MANLEWSFNYDAYHARIYLRGFINGRLFRRCKMTTYIGLALGAFFISVLHIEMQPSKPHKTAYQMELEVMFKNCSTVNECAAISRVLERVKDHNK